MSINADRIVAGVLICGLLAGCASPEARIRASTDDQYFWKRRNPYPSEIGVPPDVLNEQAGDANVEREAQCLDVFYLFAAYSCEDGDKIKRVRRKLKFAVTFGRNVIGGVASISSPRGDLYGMLQRLLLLFACLQIQCSSPRFRA